MGYTYRYKHFLPPPYSYLLPTFPLMTANTSSSSLERIKQRLVICLNQVNQSRRRNTSIPEVALPRIP